MFIDIESLKEAKDENVDIAINGSDNFFDFCKGKYILFAPSSRYYFWYLDADFWYLDAVDSIPKLGKIHSF